jgi:hypothetical protein
MNPRNFFAELKRRNVYKVVGAHAIVIDPLLRGLRDDPRYNNLLAKVMLPALS